MQDIVQHIVSDTEIAFGRPRIAGTRITVKDIVIKHLHNGQELELIAADFELPLAAVYAAMTYYYDHKSEIDRAMENDSKFAEEFRKTHDASKSLA
jgi:uncharacterized protein (DUF433 family)